MKNAYGYVRVSSRAQAADERDGIPRQQEAIRKWARANGHRVVKWFVESVSGTKGLEHRPQLQALLAALHSNGARTVVVEKLDRVARDLMLQESLIADFKRNGFTLVSTEEPDLCNDDPTRTAFRQMMGVFAQYERAMLVVKLRVARMRAKAKDPTRREGRKQFGARPGEDRTIGHIVALHKAGNTLQQIADVLNAEKVQTRTGGKWHPSQVRRVLVQQRAYTQRVQSTVGGVK